MHNREIILQKIDAQEKEWDAQIKFLQLQVASFDTERRVEFEKHLNHLNEKLKRIEERTKELKDANLQLWLKSGDKIAECWEELVHNVDYVILNYRKFFSQ